MNVNPYVNTLPYLLHFPDDNGLCPTWSDERFEFDVVCPDLAKIRFLVQDVDMFGENHFIGQACFPVNCLKGGESFPFF